MSVPAHEDSNWEDVPTAREAATEFVCDQETF
jgi:hypothetical protein